MNESQQRKEAHPYGQRIGAKHKRCFDKLTVDEKNSTGAFQAVKECPTLFSLMRKKTATETGYGRIETRIYQLCTDVDFIKLYKSD